MRQAGRRHDLKRFAPVAVAAAGLALSTALAQCSPLRPSTDPGLDAADAAADATGAPDAASPDPAPGPADAGAKLFGFEDHCWPGQNAIVASSEGRTGRGCTVCRQTAGYPFALNSSGEVGHARAGVAYAVEAWVLSGSAGLDSGLALVEVAPSTHQSTQDVRGPSVTASYSWQKLSGQLAAQTGGDILDVVIGADDETDLSPCMIVDDVTVYGPLD